MVFRRQDIPKTHRQNPEGGPRRLYPRFAKDDAFHAKVERAISYLDDMVGQRRGDLSQHSLEESLGYPKVTRCLVTTLAENYHYRSPSIADVVGDEIAAALLEWDLATPADLRGFVYLIAQERYDGVVTVDERDSFRQLVAQQIGLASQHIADLLHLDAERNAVLTRPHGRPTSANVVARYNTMLALSVLSFASEIHLRHVDLDAASIAAICNPRDVAYARVSDGGVRLIRNPSSGAPNPSLGHRIALCTMRLLLLSRGAPSGHAIVRVNDQPSLFAFDRYAMNALAPVRRAVADRSGIQLAADLAESVAHLRRREPYRLAGWTMRQATRPLVIDGAVALPELVMRRGLISVPIVPITDPVANQAALDVMTELAAIHPVIGLGIDHAAFPTVPTADAASLVGGLDTIAAQHRPTGQFWHIAEEVETLTWLPVARLAQLLGTSEHLSVRLRPLTDTGTAEFVPGVGLCGTDLLKRLIDQISAGPIDVGAVQASVAKQLGERPEADALTLHLLRQLAVVAPKGSAWSRDERAA